MLLSGGGGMTGQGANSMMGGGGGQIPGQEARNVDMSGLISALGQSQPQSGAIGLPMQQSELQNGMVLPSREFNPQGTPPSLQGIPEPGRIPMSNPMDWQNPMQGSMPMNGQVQKQQVSQQGGATGIPNSSSSAPPRPIDIATGKPYAAPDQGVDWGKLMNFTGTATEPNALVRAGVGYNQGGLIGALGYLLTDMSRQANGSSNQGF